MSVIFFLIGIGILVAGGFLAAFIWAVKSGQYDDDYTPSVRILFDDYKSDQDDAQKEKNKDLNKKNKKNEPEQSDEPQSS